MSQQKVDADSELARTYFSRERPLNLAAEITKAAFRKAIWVASIELLIEQAISGAGGNSSARGYLFQVSIDDEPLVHSQPESIENPIRKIFLRKILVGRYRLLFKSRLNVWRREEIARQRYAGNLPNRFSLLFHALPAK